MSRGHKHLYTMIDIKDESGQWIRSWIEGEPGNRAQVHTLAAKRWNGVINRCRPGGHVQRQRKTYEGCSNGFSDFQQFAEWCQSQPGYKDLEENGRLFHLDKDLLVPGNKVYSPDTCCFVPARVNCLLLFPSKTSSGLPRGASYHKRNQSFSASINEPGRGSINLGYFSCPMGAHRMWQSKKIEMISIAAKALDPKFHKVAEALLRVAAQISDDLNRGKESLF